MKNITMIINNNAITSTAPLPQYPIPPFSVSAPEYSVSFSVRFESEDEAISFAKFILNNIEVF